METKAIVMLNKKRTVFYKFNGDHYVVNEHWGKNHWLEDDCKKVTKQEGNEIYKALLAKGYEKCSKEVCDKYIR